MHRTSLTQQSNLQLLQMEELTKSGQDDNQTCCGRFLPVLSTAGCVPHAGPTTASLILILSTFSKFFHWQQL